MNARTTGDWPVSEDTLRCLGAEKAEEISHTIKEVMNPLVIAYDDNKAKITGGVFRMKIGDDTFDVSFHIEGETDGAQATE